MIDDDIKTELGGLLPQCKIEVGGRDREYFQRTIITLTPAFDDDLVNEVFSVLGKMFNRKGLLASGTIYHMDVSIVDGKETIRLKVR